MKTDGKNLRQIAIEHGIDYPKFYQRVKKLGWTIEEAIAGKRKNVSYPQKRSSTSYTVKGDEAKGKMLGFRTLESNEKRILKAIADSGMSRSDWLEDAALAKLEGRVIARDLFEEVSQVTNDVNGWIADVVRQQFNNK